MGILEMCTDKEVKQQWAEAQYNKTGNNFLLKYYEPEKCVPLVKEKMNVSNMNERLPLLVAMMVSCAEHKDLIALEKVFEYACLRLRNAETIQLTRFLQGIIRFVSLDDLSHNHWKYIKELIDIANIKMKYVTYQQHLKLMEKYLEYLFKNGKPFKEELSEFVLATTSNGRSYWPQINNGVIEKDILIQILNILPDEVKEESSNYNQVYQQLTLDVINFSCLDCNAEYCIRLLDFPHLTKFITSIVNKTKKFEDIECEIITKIVRYNQRFPQNAIMIEKGRLWEIILTVSIEQDSFKFKDLLEFMLMRKNRSELENEILKLYFNKLTDKHVSHNINFWFLKNDPEIIIPYVKRIATIKGLFLPIHQTRHTFNSLSYMKGIKLCSHLHIDVAFIDFLQEQLKDPKCETKEDIMRYLSILLPTDGFVKVVAEYFLPKKIKLDLRDEEMKKTYRSQCEVVKILKNVSEPVKMLPIVMKFCIGDYLQSALCSLYSVCYRSFENHLYLYIDILSKRGVSVQKHAVFLTCALLDYNYTVNQLKSAEQSNVSSQKHIFSVTRKYFLRNQSEDLLNLLISNMSTIDKEDTETLNSLSSIKVPKKYQALYIEKCWRYFESIRQNTVVEDYLRSLLHKIISSNDIVVSSSSEFCRDIISNYFEQKVDDLLNTELFICKVLRYKELEQKENFDLVFRIISAFKVKNERQPILRFFNMFYSIASKDCYPDFVNLFSMYWERCFTPVEMFNEHVLLKLLQVKYASPGIKNYAENVSTFMDQLIAQYGLYVFNPFKLLLKKALTSDFDDKKDEYLFLYYFLSCNHTMNNCILVIDLMDKVYEGPEKNSKEDKEIFKIYCDILQILRKVEVPIVKAYFLSYVGEI